MITPVNKRPDRDAGQLWLLLGLVFMIPLQATAQGTVNFNNKVPGSIDAPVFDVDGTNRLAGSAFLAQLYAGSSSNNLSPAGSSVAFQTGTSAGYFAGGSVTINFIPPGGTAFVRVRAWAVSGGASFEAALASGSKTGQSTVFAVVTGGFGFPPSPAATLVGLQSFNLTLPVVEVSNTADSGPGSLRQALQAVAPGGTVNFAPGLSGTIKLSSGELLIGKGLTIAGPGPAKLSVSGGSLSRVFNITGSGDVAISGLTITGGRGDDGAALKSSAANVTISECTLTGNEASGRGGGIFNSGTLTILASTVSANTTSLSSGGGGGIANSGTLAMTNTTVSGNTSASQSGGGGIFNSATLLVHNSTIASNTATMGSGGGILNSGGTATFKNTIIAGNTSNSGGPDVNGSFISKSYNLVGIGDGSSGFQGAQDQVGTGVEPMIPNLRPLADNGGPTFTHALICSPAIDAGDNTDAPATDQRGSARIYNGCVDIGAFELQPGDKLWEFDAGFGLSISPAIGADGTIYFGTGAEQQVAGKLYALNPDGTTKWTLDLDALDPPYIDPLSTAPAIGPDGTIYVGSELGRLFAFEDKFTNGSVKWSFQIPSSNAIYSSPAIATDGTVYFAATDSNLYAIKDNQTYFARMTAEIAFTSRFRSAPAVGPDGTIYVGSTSNILYAFEDKGTSFAKKWEFPTGDKIVSSPAIGSDGTIYFGSFDTKLYSISPSGVTNWTVQAGSAIGSSAAVGKDGTVYIGSHDHRLYAVKDGTTNWIVTTGDEVRSSPAISEDGNIYVGSSDGNLYSISPSGTTNWMFDAKSSIDFMSPTIGLDGTVYIGNDNGKLYAIKGTSRLADDAPWPKFHRNLRQTANAGVVNGDKRWESETDFDVYSAPALGTNGTVFSLSAVGTVSAFTPQGDKLWETNLRVLDESLSLAIGSDGTLYVAGRTYDQTNNGKLLALNPDNGSQRWPPFETTVGFYTSSPAIAKDGTVYIGNPDGKLYAIKPDNSLKWSLVIGPANASTPAIGTDGTIYVASSNMLLAVRDEGNQGRPFWPNPATTTGEVLESSPAIGADGTIYIGTYRLGTNDGRLNAFNPDGTMKWVNPEAYGYNIRSSAVIGVDGTIFVGVDADTYKLVALDARTGSKKGEFDTHKIYSYATPAIADDGTIYFAAGVNYGCYFAQGGGVLYALRFNGTNFIKQWEFGAGGTIDSSPAIGSDGTVYFGSADRRLYALKGSSGLASTAWPMFGHDLQHTGRVSFEVQPPTLSVLGIPNGLFALRVTAANGQILVIQATTNLANWQGIHTNTTANGTFDFSDPDTAQFPKRFYRALGR